MAAGPGSPCPPGPSTRCSVNAAASAGSSWPPHYDNLDLVFTRPDGQPLRPQYVLDHLRRLAADAGLPAIRVHDLRHFAATIMIN